MFVYQRLCFLTMITIWMAIKVEPNLLPLAVLSLSMVAVLLFTIFAMEISYDKVVSIAPLEKGLHITLFSIFKYNNLCASIYDLPWYDWSASQQMALIPIIATLQHPPRLSGITEELTLEWFGNFINKSYSVGCTMANLT